MWYQIATAIEGVLEETTSAPYPNTFEAKIMTEDTLHHANKTVASTSSHGIRSTTATSTGTPSSSGPVETAPRLAAPTTDAKAAALALMGLCGVVALYL